MDLRTVLVTAGLTLAAAVPAFAEGAPRKAGERLRLGSEAPLTDVKMKGVDGKSVSIADVRGDKGTLVIFSCNACPWVKLWEQRIADLGNEYRKQGIGVIVINSNDPQAVAEDSFEEMQRRAEKLGLEFPYVVDETSDVARAFGATKTPEAFLFDAKGKLVYYGAVDDNAKEPEQVEEAWLKDALAAVVAGEEVAKAETKAFGCTIKYRAKAKAGAAQDV